MNNSLALQADEQPPRLVASIYSRLIRWYSFQEILFEYCICLLLLVSVALVIFGVTLLRSEIRGGYAEVILLWRHSRVIGSPMVAQIAWKLKHTAVEESAHHMSEDRSLWWRWGSSAIIWLCWERKREAVHSTYSRKFRTTPPTPYTRHLSWKNKHNST